MTPSDDYQYNYQYENNPQAIENESFRQIRELTDLSGPEPRSAASGDARGAQFGFARRG